jgi:outer membrane protein TolC
MVSAEREAAATWSEIAVARANRLPRIDLTAMLSGNWLQAFGEAAHFETWSVGASLTAPLIDGGIGGANVRGAQARYRAAVATLRKTVRTTVQNIEDALAEQQSAEQRVITSQQEVEAATATLRATEQRWHAGAISQFDLQTVRRQYTSAQDDAIAALRDRALAWVDLVLASNTTSAMGGMVWVQRLEFDGGEWKEAKLHADCYVSIEGDYYSAPHIHRHKKLRIKLTENQVEIFLNLERLAITNLR